MPLKQNNNPFQINPSCATWTCSAPVLFGSSSSATKWKRIISKSAPSLGGVTVSKIRFK